MFHGMCAVQEALKAIRMSPAEANKAALSLRLFLMCHQLQHFRCSPAHPAIRYQAVVLDPRCVARGAWPALTSLRLPVGGAARGRQGGQVVGGGLRPPGRAAVGRYLGCAACVLGSSAKDKAVMHKSCDLDEPRYVGTKFVLRPW